LWYRARLSKQPFDGTSNTFRISPGHVTIKKNRLPGPAAAYFGGKFNYKFEQWRIIPFKSKFSCLVRLEGGSPPYNNLGKERMSDGLYGLPRPWSRFRDLQVFKFRHLQGSGMPLCQQSIMQQVRSLHPPGHCAGQTHRQGCRWFRCSRAVGPSIQRCSHRHYKPHWLAR